MCEKEKSCRFVLWFKNVSFYKIVFSSTLVLFFFSQQTLPTPILAYPSTAPKTATTKISGKTPRVSSNVKGTKTYVKPGQLASSKGLGLYRSTEPHKNKGKEQGTVLQWEKLNSLNVIATVLY